VALKTCKTQTGALLALARAHGTGIMVQDLTNPMLAAVETNAMQFYPAASVAEARVHPGIYRRRAGRVRLDRPVRRQLAPPARGRRGLRHRPFGNLSVPQALPASNGWHAACCAIRAGLPTTGGSRSLADGLSSDRQRILYEVDVKDVRPGFYLELQRTFVCIVRMDCRRAPFGRRYPYGIHADHRPRPVPLASDASQSIFPLGVGRPVGRGRNLRSGSYRFKFEANAFDRCSLERYRAGHFGRLELLGRAAAAERGTAKCYDQHPIK
jgi:hypothetical protein